MLVFYILAALGVVGNMYRTKSIKFFTPYYTTVERTRASFFGKLLTTIPLVYIVVHDIMDSGRGIGDTTWTIALLMAVYVISSLIAIWLRCRKHDRLFRAYVLYNHR